MSGKRTPGALRAIWNFAKRQRVLKRKANEECVGIDEHGNKYYWRRPDPELRVKESRYVVPPDEEIDPVMLVLPENVPQEWDAWLRGRTANPPTEEDIQKSLLDRLKMQERVKALEDKERLQDSGEASETIASSKNEITEMVQGDTRKKSFPTYSDLEIYPGQFVGQQKKD